MVCEDEGGMAYDMGIQGKKMERGHESGMYGEGCVKKE